MVHPYLEAVVLGVVQGLTEFLPISSSGHLIIVPKVFGWPYFGKAFDVALHMGTFGALFAYFWKDLWGMVSGKSSNPNSYSGKFLLMLLILSTIPGVLAGFFLNNFIEERFSSIHLILGMMAAFAILLWISDLVGKGTKNLKVLTVWDAVLLGIAQALALIPGVSRSGITITTGRFFGLSREDAARYSFLMAIPITGGAGAYEGMKLLKHGFGNVGVTVFALGVLSSLVVGYLCISFLLRYLQKHGMFPFVAYRLILAIGLFLIIR